MTLVRLFDLLFTKDTYVCTPSASPGNRLNLNCDLDSRINEGKCS